MTGSSLYRLRAGLPISNDELAESRRNRTPDTGNCLVLRPDGGVHYKVLDPSLGEAFWRGLGQYSSA
jgi:hypothetical protein